MGYPKPHANMITAAMVTPRCCICTKEVKYLPCGRDEEAMKAELQCTPPQNINVDDAISGTIYGAYGSCKHDGDVLFVCICDDCGEARVKAGIIVPLYCYMTHSAPDWNPDGVIAE